MPRQLPATGIPDDFGYAKHPELKAWIQEEFPTVDPDQTMKRFIDYAEDAGRMASKWTACFKRVIRVGIEKRYDGIVVYRKGKEFDPKWNSTLEEARACGFREPTEKDGLEAYRNEMKGFQRNLPKPKDERGANVHDFASSFAKRFGS